MIKCIAIDEEPLALEVIRLHCEKTSFIELKKSFLSVYEAIDFLNCNEIDVVFLDINMPEANGLTIRSFISSKIQIVYATAYQDYALDSYNHGVTDYLLKPISFDRFYKAALKCFESNRINTNIESEYSAKNLESIVVRGDKKIVQIPIGCIDYIEGLKDYAKIYYSSNKKIVIRESLKNILAKLENYNFGRIHRSFIVPIDKISSISGDLVKIGSYEIPINKIEKDKIIEHYKKKGILGDRSV